MRTVYDKIAESFISSDEEVKRLFAPLRPQPADLAMPFTEFFKKKRKKEELPGEPPPLPPIEPPSPPPPPLPPEPPPETHRYNPETRTWELIDKKKEVPLSRMPWSKELEPLGEVSPFKEIRAVMTSPEAETVKNILGFIGLVGTIGITGFQGVQAVIGATAWRRLPEYKAIVDFAKANNISRQSKVFKDAETALKSAVNLYRGGAKEAGNEIMSRYHASYARAMAARVTASPTGSQAAKDAAVRAITAWKPQLPSFAPGGTAIPGQTKPLAEIMATGEMKLGPPARTLSKLATPEATAQLKGLQTQATKAGFDLEAVEGIAPGEYWVSLTRRHGEVNARLDWLTKLPKKDMSSAQLEIVSETIGRVPDTGGLKRFYPFKTLADAQRFIETGDTSGIITKVRLKGEAWTPEKLATAQRAMQVAPQEFYVPPAKPFKPYRPPKGGLSEEAAEARLTALQARLTPEERAEFQISVQPAVTAEPITPTAPAVEIPKARIPVKAAKPPVVPPIAPKLPTKIPPLPPAKAVVPSEPVIKPDGKLWLPEPPRVPAEYMAYARKEVAGSFRGKQGVFDTVEQAHQQVLKARDVGQNTVPYVMSYLRQAGDVVKEFGVVDGLATKVFSKEARSLAINDVLSNYTHYPLTPTQLELAKRYGEVYREALKLAKSYGVKIPELSGPDEFWQYIARRVKGKLNPITGEYEMPKTGVGGFRMGAKISAQKERVFDEMAEGLNLGFLYENPDQVMANHIQGIYRLIGNKQAEDMVKPLTRLITKEAPLTFGERAVAQPALAFRAANREITNAIDKIFALETEIKWLRVGADINRAMVGQVAALDISAPFIQGLPMIGHDLKMGLKGKSSLVWARAYGNMWKSLFNPERIAKFRMDNAALYKRFIEAGGMTGESEFVTGVSKTQTALGKIPGAGKTLKEIYRQTWGRAGQSYSDFLEIAKVRFFEQMEPIWQRAGQNIYSLGAVTNRMAGATSAQARGVGITRRLVEGNLAFAPNYFRSSLLMIKDLMSRGATAREVQSSIAALLGIGAAVYYAEEKIRGREPKMKPWPKRLGGDGAEAYTIEIGDTRVGLGSWMYGMVKMLAEVGAVAVDDPAALLVWNQNHPVVKFLKSKQAASLGLATELAAGRNFWGKRFDSPDDYLMRIVESLIPISAQPIVTEEPKGGVVEVGAQFMGMRAFPYTLQSRWTDEGAFKAYDEIPTDPIEVKAKGIQSRSQYRKANPDVEAKLFITGQVNTVSTYSAKYAVLKLIQENNIDSSTIKGIIANREKKAKGEELGVRDTTITETDKLVSLIDRNYEIPQPVPPSKSAKWDEVRPFLTWTMVQGLDRLWYKGGELTPLEERDLREVVFERYPFGEKDFDTWVRQTLRQVYESSF